MTLEPMVVSPFLDRIAIRAAAVAARVSRLGNACSSLDAIRCSALQPRYPG